MDFLDSCASEDVRKAVLTVPICHGVVNVSSEVSEKNEEYSTRISSVWEISVLLKLQFF